MSMKKAQSFVGMVLSPLIQLGIAIMVLVFILAKLNTLQTTSSAQQAEYLSKDISLLLDGLMAIDGNADITFGVSQPDVTNTASYELNQNEAKTTIDRVTKTQTWTPKPNTQVITEQLNYAGTMVIPRIRKTGNAIIITDQNKEQKTHSMLRYECKAMPLTITQLNIDVENPENGKEITPFFSKSATITSKGTIDERTAQAKGKTTIITRKGKDKEVIAYYNPKNEQSKKIACEMINNLVNDETEKTLLAPINTNLLTKEDPGKIITENEITIIVYSKTDANSIASSIKNALGVI